MTETVEELQTKLNILLNKEKPIKYHLHDFDKKEPWLSLYITPALASEIKAIEDTYEITASQLKDILQDRDAVTRELAKHLKDTKESLADHALGMDEAILRYRADMLNFRDSFKKAKDEELDATYSLWEKYEEDVKSLRAKVNESVLALKPLTEALAKVSEGLYKLSKNDASVSFNSIMTMVERYEALPEASKKVFGKFLDTYKGN